MVRPSASSRTAIGQARTAIARRQKVRPGGSSFKGVGAAGNVITFSVPQGSPLDFTAGITCSFAWTMKLDALPVRFFGKFGGTGKPVYLEIISTGQINFGAWNSGVVKSWSLAALADHLYHRYVISYDGTNVQLYKDGVAFGAPQAAAFDWSTSTTSGSTLAGQTNFNLNGVLDDFIGYNGYAWTAADVASDWYDGTLPAAAPAIRYTFDERFGTTLTDSSGNGYTGTITTGGFSDEMPPWSLPGTAAKRYPDGFNPYAYLNGGAAYFSDLGATVAAGLISQLNDQSGNGWHMIQNTGANKPAYTAGGINGKSYLVYSAFTGTFMLTAQNFNVLNGAAGITVYAVGSIAADHNGGDFVNHYSGAAGTFGMGQVGGSTGNFNSNLNTVVTGVNNFGNTNIAPNMTQTAIWSMRYDGVHNRSYTNGRPKYQDAQGAPSGVLASPSIPLAIGNRGGGAGGVVNLYALIVAIGAHDDDTMRWYHRYLSDYYQVPLLA